MNIFGMWLQMTFPGHAKEVTRDQLGNLPAGPWADPFRPPRPMPTLDTPYDGTVSRKETPHE